MPYKDFSAGETLFAADVQTYLMNQGIMVFASKAARDAALTGNAREGMVTYIGAGLFEYYNGSSWEWWPA